MKEELEKLGFKEYGLNAFKLKLEEYIQIVICNKNEVWIENDEVDSILLFEYNHEKLKQLIKILS